MKPFSHLCCFSFQNQASSKCPFGKGQTWGVDYFFEGIHLLVVLKGSQNETRHLSGTEYRKKKEEETPFRCCCPSSPPLPFWCTARWFTALWCASQTSCRRMASSRFRPGGGGDLSGYFRERTGDLNLRNSYMQPRLHGQRLRGTCVSNARKLEAIAGL